MPDPRDPDPPPPGDEALADLDSLEGRDLLFGRIALRRGAVSLADLEDSLYLQEREPERGRIGEILVARGLITEVQRRTILEEIRERASLRGDAGLPVAEGLFGRLGVRRGLLSEDQLNAALREQESERAQGRRRRIGIILIEHGALTRAGVERILNFQGKEIMLCDRCAKHFNVRGLLRSLPCPLCAEPLRLPLEIPPPDVEGDLD